MAIGSVLCPLGLVLSSLATSLWTIYLAQGLLFGIGAGLCFAPSIALPSQWFNKNRSLATGLAVSGSGIGAVAISPMTERLFSTLGYRNTLRVEGAMGFGILMLATAMAFSRYRPAGTFSIIDTKLLTKDMLITILFCVIMPFGYLGPFFLAPQYASFLHRTPAEGAALISIMSGMNSISRIAMGFIADRLGRINTMFMCTFLAGIFTMVVWEFSTSYGPYIAYCVLYGLTGGAFVSLLPVLIADIVGVENIQRGIGMSYTMTVFGSLFGTPLIGLLLQRYGWTDAIQFCGATTVFSSLVVLYLRYLRSNGKIFLII
ncbi:major facilitator superfamily domain-containing protein [Halteromyces radiatus]|uniref:major facilitator superfamily domain-containing protein n=1 Tax=Halteromyces radiatus TaxID=101107 RepID=UPI0022206673|nr:major facilitator superfamily domain-containing protein [Halteromyces radiatus]KAI8089262.1 major facilitator superfamily domain-containing protein [Halteromyces radiatus]